MAGTRSSARLSAKVKHGSSPGPSQSKRSPSGGTGSKRKAEAGAGGKTKANKAQKTIDETMLDEGRDSPKEDNRVSGEGINGQDGAKKEDMNGKAGTNGTLNSTKSEEGRRKNGFDTMMDAAAGEKEDKNITAEGTGSKVSATANAVEDSSKRKEATPSSILEKGIIYFFFRGRVGIGEPASINDIARSYIVLRPIPHGAKLGEGPIGDAENGRLLSLPKKVLPVSPKDRFMVFVEKAKARMEDIKSQLSPSDYTTKTAGARHTPAAAPIGEGVYAITKTGRETHLAYILTIPNELDEVQKGVGLRKRGSYFTSAKNPQSAAPANASLPKGPEYPQEIIDEFHGRGWMPLEPKLLNYENTQFLIIGHGDGALEKATKPQDGEDEKLEKETPMEEMEKLEHEDDIRVEHLKNDDAIFADLGLSVETYPRLQSSWN